MQGVQVPRLPVFIGRSHGEAIEGDSEGKGVRWIRLGILVTDMHVVYFELKVLNEHIQQRECLYGCLCLIALKLLFQYLETERMSVRGRNRERREAISFVAAMRVLG